MRTALLSAVACVGLLVGCGPDRLVDVSDPGAVGPGEPVEPVEPGEPNPVSDLPREEWRPLQTELLEYALDIAEPDWERLLANEDAEDYWVPGRFTYDGRSWSVEVRLRGKSTRAHPKKSFQVRFPKDDKFFGRARLELMAEYRDSGQLTEKLWWDLAAAAGLMVPQATYVNLTINDAYYGVMTQVERVDKAFLVAHGRHPDGSVYRAGHYDGELRHIPALEYQDPWEKRTNESEPFDELWAFLHDISRTPAHELEDTLEQQMELDAYITWMAVDALIANDLIMDARPFLIRDGGTRKWIYVPWDLNNANSTYSRLEDLNQWNGAERPLVNFTIYDRYAYDLAEERTAIGYAEDMRPTWSVLSTRIVDDARLRERFIARTRELIDSHFTEEVLGARIDEMERLLAPHVSRDPYADQAFVARSSDFLKGFIRDRRAFLATALEEVERHDEKPWRILRVGVDVTGGQFVQIVNASNQRLSLQGLKLTSVLRNAEQGQTLRSIQVEPGEWVTLSSGATSASERLEITFDPAEAEIGLFAEDARTALDASFVPPLTPGQSYGLTGPE